jgi:tetraacyldisaccharide 4'-kinase
MNLPLPLRILLWPLSLVYGVVVRIKAVFYEKGWLKAKRLKGTVVSVGNLTTGGTGKTPMVIWLAEKFLADGKRVAILSRGYRGADGTSDEIELMKSRLQNRVVFGVGKDRFAAGSQLESQQPIDIFILDDGFQHQQLSRDLNILMLDGSKKLKKEWLIPAGELREPLAECRRADILVVTRKTDRPDVEASDSHKYSIFYSQTRLLGFRLYGKDKEMNYLGELGNVQVFAFCGIGNPKAFFTDLRRWHVDVAGSKAFRDHHHYSPEDLRQIEEDAKAVGAAALVTTEKDAQNLGGGPAGTMPIYLAAIDLVLNSESEFLAAMERKLNTSQSVPA